MGASSLSRVLPVDASGNPTTDQPSAIAQGSFKQGGLYGAYVQDAWRILPKVTLNLGLRLDTVEQYTHESQLSPRVNVAWEPAKGTTVHAGFARYFTPPPFELVGSSAIAQFLGTTAAPAVTRNDPVRAERASYFDIGISQVVVPGLTLGLGAYYKISHDLIDEGPFGAPVILTAFNYEQGLQEGIEATASFDKGPLSAYGNLALSRAMGRNIVSAEYNFTPAELAFIQGNWIHLDHDQAWTGSAGLSYALDRDTGHETKLSADAILQSGLRASTPTVPNGTALPLHGIVNLSVVHKLASRTELRLDVINLTDSVYEIRDGTGVGVGAPQYGLRRTILAGVTQRF